MTDETQTQEGQAEAPAVGNVVKNPDFKSTGSWVNGFIDEQTARAKDDEGKETGPERVELLRELCAVNNIDVPDSYANLNVGMQRMNMGNRLRAAGRKRGGLMNRDGTFVRDTSVAEGDITHNPDGTKITPPANDEGDQADAA